ncbi:MAG TPA: 4-hydroxy-3-methylbut-2-enyl diphosphate reductase [Gemmatimonadales bacterium]|jgi:4-hydroxy-3-methylbut-2-enyl diphosphate reductase|nr:4-hydroxy-3-methylbut-2-enyl diphosphate reductase [Gemmatimonadales bacterium]
MTKDTYFRRGFGLKAEIEGQLTADYASSVVDSFRAHGNVLTVGPLTFRLAKEFGFCYGVDRAVDYAYETRAKFPDRRIFLVGEIIHNPHVNHKLEAMGIRFLEHTAGAPFDFSDIGPEDVVILPAFGVTVGDFARLREIGCVLVDTTCGSVLNVWKRVESYARDGFTAVIHGKYYHEETKATASQVEKYPGGRYLVIRDMAEARPVFEFIEGRGDAAALRAQFAHAASPDFDPARDLARVGIANQTTMLAGESLAIAAEFKKSFAARHGAEEAERRFRSFDTLCSATQERQDAVHKLLEEHVDLMLVVGGYNSSNTCHLAALAQSKGVTTFHLEDALCVDTAAGTLRHQPVGAKQETVAPRGWLEGHTIIGLTAGASTPNNKVGETVARVCEMAGLGAELERALAE